MLNEFGVGVVHTHGDWYNLQPMSHLDDDATRSAPNMSLGMVLAIPMREAMSPVADGNIAMLVVPLELEQIHLELHKWTSLAPVDLWHVAAAT